MTGTWTELEERIATRIEESGISPHLVHAEVRGGLVFVRGSAPADVAVQICAALRRIPGVDEVENRVRIIEHPSGA